MSISCYISFLAFLGAFRELNTTDIIWQLAVSLKTQHLFLVHSFQIVLSVGRVYQYVSLVSLTSYSTMAISNFPCSSQMSGCPIYSFIFPFSADAYLRLECCFTLLPNIDGYPPYHSPLLIG